MEVIFRERRGSRWVDINDGLDISSICFQFDLIEDHQACVQMLKQRLSLCQIGYSCQGFIPFRPCN